MKSLLSILILIAFSGCGFRRWMYQQPVHQPLEESTFFADKRSARPLVPNTIARGELREDAAYYQGKVGGKVVDQFPFKVVREDLLRGKQRYEIFCTPCHDYTGYGNGMIVQRGFSRPASLHDPRLKQSPIGHFFEVMTEGWGRMPSYAAQIPVKDRWAIAAYIRALQLSQSASQNDVPPAEWAKLERNGK